MTPLLEHQLKEILSTWMKKHPFELRYLEVEVDHQTSRSFSKTLKSEVLEKWEQGNDSKKVFISLSHTQTLQETYLIAIASSIPIGVDLEFSHRKVHPKLLSRITLPAESQFDLKAIEFWVIKEAAFKANPQNKGSFVSQYSVTSWDRQTNTGTLSLPHPATGSCRFKLISIENKLFAFAIYQ